MLRLTSVPILLLILCIMSFLTLARDGEEPCSSRETVYPVVKTAILDEASYQGVRVRYAVAGERLDIIGSKTFGAWCWLEVKDGWVIDSPRALSSEPPDSATVSASAMGRSCYRAEKAYVVGNMNIRSSASTESAVVARARAGDEFAVASSQRGETWCWLEINRGWLANTARVRSTRPTQPVVTGAVSPATSQPANIDNCCFVDRQCASEQEWVDGYWAFQNKQCSPPTNASTQEAIQGRPRLVGSPAFIRFIEATLDLLEARTTYWYRYVIDQTSVIIEGDPFRPGICGARVHTGARRVTVDTDCQTWGITQMAPTLVHEACHVYHHDNGITYPEGKLREEWECGKPSIASSTAIGVIEVRHMPWDEYVAWMSTDPFK